MDAPKTLKDWAEDRAADIADGFSGLSDRFDCDDRSEMVGAITHALLEADKNGYERGSKYFDAQVAGHAKTAADLSDALREVERLKRLDVRPVGWVAVLLDHDRQIEAEKRRTAAYREVAIAEIECGRTFNRSEHETVEQFFAEIKKYKAGKVDEAAQKLLADSGGEKKA